MTVALPRLAPVSATAPLALTGVLEAPPIRESIGLVLRMVSIVLGIFIVNLLLVSQVEHAFSQNALYQQLRLQLAQGSTPVSPLLNTGRPVPAGTPVALMSAMDVGIGHEVVVDGSSSSQTMAGVGHRRDSVLPCQAGTAVLLGRESAYGGIGMAWAHLQKGQLVSFTTGQGHCDYQVTGLRYPGDDAPPPPGAKQGALVLTTATGWPFMPSQVLRIDARLLGPAKNAPNVRVGSSVLPASEQPMADDPSQFYPFVLLLELVAVAVLATVWLWKRWGRLKTWLVAAPVLVALSLVTATSATLLLPNLI
jgi:sortase A